MELKEKWRIIVNKTKQIREENTKQKKLKEKHKRQTFQTQKYGKRYFKSDIKRFFLILV